MLTCCEKSASKFGVQSSAWRSDEKSGRGSFLGDDDEWCVELWLESLDVNAFSNSGL